MKALIRNNEVVRESDGIEGVDWNTGFPLTSPEWAGGSYTLVQDFVEPEGPETPIVIEKTPIETVPGTDETGEPDDEVVELNGRRYTKTELRLLLG